MKARKSITRFTIVMALAVLAVGVFAGAALAEDDQIGDFTLTGQANVTMTTVTMGHFTEAQYSPSGTAATEASASTFNVTDARGSGAGWKVSFGASQFTAGTHKLPTGIMMLQVMSAPTVVSGSTNKPTITQESAIAVDGTTREITHADASDDEFQGQGMGEYAFPAAHFHVTVPVGAYAATYQSTLTITLAQAP